MEFPGVLKEEYVEIPGVQLKKKLDFQGYSTKLIRNLHASWFWTLKFPMGVTQFWRIFRGESLFSLKFLRVQ